MRFSLNEIKIEVTHNCPLACIHCSSDALPGCTREMSLVQCLNLIREAHELGARQIAFSGGEPLVWQGIEDAVAYCHNLGYTVKIYTSGNVNNVAATFAKLKEAGLAGLVFGLYGPTTEAHDYITRVQGSFQLTVDAMQLGYRLGLTTEIHWVALAKNYRTLREIAILSKKVHAKKVSVLRFVPQGRGILLTDDVLTTKQNIELRQSIIDLRNEGYDIRTGSPLNFYMLNEKPACLSGCDRLIIGPDLKIQPCDAFKKADAKELVGTFEYSIVGEKNLTECWEKSPYFNKIRDYLHSDFMEPCKSCENLDRCKSGCLAQKILAHGDFKKKPDPACLRGVIDVKCN